MHQLTLIDDEINKAYKLKELYRSFDNISKDEINDYDMEKELNSIIKQFRYSQIEEMKEVADTLNNDYSHVKALVVADICTTSIA